jgi:hypothetical protein
MRDKYPNYSPEIFIPHGSIRRKIVTRHGLKYVALTDKAQKLLKREIISTKLKLISINQL